MTPSGPARVLAIHRYYWPDTPPYASLLRAIVAQWTQDGHSVEVLSSQPSYKPETVLGKRPRQESVDGSTVLRIAMRPDRSGRIRRIYNLIAFPVAVALRMLIGEPYDVVMCSTSPPVVLAAAVSWVARRRGSQFIYHCMDVHPEIGALSGEFANPLIRRFLTWVDTRTCLRATTVVVLSEDMKTALVRRDAALEQRVLVINNFDLPDFDVVEAAPPLARGPEDLRIVFAGNIGRYQGLERIVRAVLECDDRLEGVKLVLMGEGAAKQRLVELAAKVPAERRDRVAFVPHGSVAETRALLGTADLGLVSLAPQVISYAYPSKTATYLSQGLPLLVDVEMSSQLARMVEKEGVGRCLPRDSADLVSVLVELVSDQDEIAGMAARARAVWAERFAAGTTLPRWSGLLAGVLEGRG